jgi:hypothetical protein
VRATSANTVIPTIKSATMKNANDKLRIIPSSARWDRGECGTVERLAARVRRLSRNWQMAVVVMPAVVAIALAVLGTVETPCAARPAPAPALARPPVAVTGASSTAPALEPPAVSAVHPDSTGTESCFAELSPGSDRLVGPIVDDLMRATAFEQDTTAAAGDSAAVHRERAHGRIKALYADPSAESDEAIAALARVAIGGHDPDDLACVAIARGSRMLPLLDRFVRCAPRGGGWTVPPALLLGPEAVQEVRDDVFAGAECEDGIWG